jgi:prenylcysteine oxidase/farnesylcysteine lyase
VLFLPVSISLPLPPSPLMLNFIIISGLKKRQSRNSRFGLYNGQEFIFTESDWKIITLAKLAWRYGYDIITLQNYIGDMLNKFER